MWFITIGRLQPSCYSMACSSIHLYTLKCISKEGELRIPASYFFAHMMHSFFSTSLSTSIGVRGLQIEHTSQLLAQRARISRILWVVEIQRYSLARWCAHIHVNDTFGHSSWTYSLYVAEHAYVHCAANHARVCVCVCLRSLHCDSFAKALP